MWGIFLQGRPRMLTRYLFAVATLLLTLIIGLVNWVELYRYWRRRQQRSSWLESSPISRTVQSRFRYSQRIHGTVHRGTWTDSGSSPMIFAADILEPCLQNIMPTLAHLFIEDFQTAKVHLKKTKSEKQFWVRWNYSYFFVSIIIVVVVVVIFIKYKRN